MDKPKWIWYDYGHELVNAWMQARRAFELDRVPKRAVVRVTADAKYHLYVNGTRVARGPARGFQKSWPIDTVDIAPFLTQGTNVLAALVHTPGVSTFQYIHQGYAGFLFEGSIGKLNLNSGPEWKVRKATEYLQATTRLSLQLGFQEHFDARTADDNWRNAGFDDSKWGISTCKPYGSMPWHALEERGIPMMAETPVVPGTLIANATCASIPLTLPTENPVVAYLNEKPVWTASNQLLREQDGLARLIIPEGKSNETRLVLLDFKTEVAGCVEIEIADATGDEIIDLIGVEAVDKSGAPVIIPVTDGCYVSMAGRLVLRPCENRHEWFDLWGFRYLIVSVRNASRALEAGVRLISVGYPLEVRGSFASSDDTLNAVHDMSVRTQQLCMFDAYVDCPWREQAQWWGDARVQARNTFILSADARLLARGIRQIGTQQLESGLTYGHTPTYGHNCILPDFTLTWVVTHLDYYWQTGDLSLFRSMRENVLRAFSYFEEAEKLHGLIGYDDRYWLFLDWCNIFKEKGYPTIYNLYYLMALEAGSQLFKLSNDTKTASALARKAVKLRLSILAHLYDAKKQEFLGGIEWNGKPARETRAHAYALAILLDLVPERSRVFADRVLLPLCAGSREADNIPSPWFMYYIFEALKKTGDTGAITDCIRRWWGGWVMEGFTTVPEVWKNRLGDHSLCHAWSAHPILHFSEITLGIRQNAVAWKRIIFSPDFSGLDSAKGSVATPLGTVSAAWTKTGKSVSVMLTLPRGMKAELRLPGEKDRTVEGRYRATLQKS